MGRDREPLGPGTAARGTKRGSPPPGGALEKVKSLFLPTAHRVGRFDLKVLSKRAGYLPQPQFGFGASLAAGASLPTVRTQAIVPLRPPLSITVSVIV